MFLEIKGLTFVYNKNEKPIFDNFSMTMNKEDIACIMGPSGCGKSTLLRLIAGLENPQSGEIIIDGQTVFSSSQYVEPYLRHVGMVFQDYALFPHMKVKDNIAYGLKKLSKQEKENRVNELLTLIDLHGHENKYPHELSGGQQQRVALARSLAPRPKLLLMDEPFSNLDTDLRGQIREDVKRILEESSTTCLLVSHDKEDANALNATSIYITK